MPTTLRSYYNKAFSDKYKKDILKNNDFSEVNARFNTFMKNAHDQNAGVVDLNIQNFIEKLDYTADSKNNKFLSFIKTLITTSNPQEMRDQLLIALQDIAKKKSAEDLQEIIKSYEENKEYLEDSDKKHDQTIKDVKDKTDDTKEGGGLRGDKKKSDEKELAEKLAKEDKTNKFKKAMEDTKEAKEDDAQKKADAEEEEKNNKYLDEEARKAEAEEAQKKAEQEADRRRKQKEAEQAEKAEQDAGNNNSTPEDPQANAGSESTTDSQPPTTEQPRPRKMTEEQEKKQVIKEADIPTYKSKADLIPDHMLTNQDKTEQELKNDINYFFVNFSDKLKALKNTYSKINQMKIIQLKRFHARIIGILDPNKKRDLNRAGEKTGVIIDAEEYIRRVVNQQMIDEALKKFNPEQMAPLAGDSDKKKDSEMDVGNYEIKRAPSGRLASQREPVYKYIPSTAEPELPAYMRRRKLIELPKTKKRTVITTAKKEFKDDPFLTASKHKRINLIF